MLLIENRCIEIQYAGIAHQLILVYLLFIDMCNVPLYAS